VATQPALDLNWKQEVNRRVAAHMSRREAAEADQSLSAIEHHGASSRAAQAAARVAARYAHAPSYSQMLADEARAAVRAAEAASQAALKMQAAAQSVLAGLETAARVAPPEEPDLVAPGPPPSSSTFFDSFLGIERPFANIAQVPPAGDLEIRWEPDLPLRPSGPPQALATRPQLSQPALPPQDWHESAAYGEPVTVEPAQPIHGNLIAFPRELIAPRRARPRIAEGPLAPAEGEPGQLSIFEVDPGAISTQPETVTAPAQATDSGWSKLLLDAERAPEPAAESASSARASEIQLAPLGLRVLAAVVDFTLIGAGFVAAALIAAGNLTTQPSIKPMEFTAVCVLFVLGLLYQAFFFLAAGATPGMRYACISLSTFDGQKPTRRQLRSRVGAVLLSLLPVGLGVLWAIFDEDHLSWHDRISHTYQRCA